MFNSKPKILSVFLAVLLVVSCSVSTKQNSTDQSPQKDLTAKEILGNPDYLGISYGGYRDTTLKVQPTIAQLKEDMQILHAMGIKFVRTYKTHYPHAHNLLKAIRELKNEDPNFEMYVMLGIWIDCENARSKNPNHDGEDLEANTIEIQKAVAWTNEFPDIVKVMAVGNEAMVKWAAAYYVQPGVILKWVNHLQNLKKEGKLPADVWITSSDNFASWGGGGGEYHVEDLKKLMQAVDYISMHTYPMHDTHYNPNYWGNFEGEETFSERKKIAVAMKRTQEYAMTQFASVKSYMKSLGIDKPIHIGETGWASASNGFYSATGTRACDEYKEALYYNQMREWTNREGLSCFYFQAFDEIWKDAKNPGGSENHFGLLDVNGKAKYAIWDLVDQGVFKGLTRDGNPITKTYGGDEAALMKEVLVPPMKGKAPTN